MLRIANIVLTIGITGLLLCGTEAWLTSRESRRAAPAVIANRFAPAAVAGASHTLDVVVDEVDESDVDEPPVGQPMDGEADETDATADAEADEF